MLSALSSWPDLLLGKPSYALIEKQTQCQEVVCWRKRERERERWGEYMCVCMYICMYVREGGECARQRKCEYARASKCKERDESVRDVLL